MIGVIFSIVVVLAGGASSLRRRMVLIKKNRIDDYYSEVLDIEKNLDNEKDPGTLSNYLDKIRIIKRNAFKLLIEEKLTADESFRIFITLSNETIERIEKTLAK